MSNPYFKFKQFTVYHDKCAMKVGTDGVLLGAWADISGVTSVLDIGAGSGLVSLMLAQRNPELRIQGIDIDGDAALQANENYRNSPFKNIEECVHISLHDFYLKNASSEFDMIISNPPFFSRSLKSPDKQRTKARHADSLPVEELIGLSSKMLSEKGRISFIFPSSDIDYLMDLAASNKMSVTKVTNVYPVSGSKSKRVLLEFSKEKRETEISGLVIEESRHRYSPQFTEMVKAFYLKL